MTTFNCTIRISGPKMRTMREKDGKHESKHNRFRIYKTMRIFVLPYVGTTLINYNPVLSSPKASVSIYSGAMSYLCQETRTTQKQQKKQLNFQAISVSLSASGPCSAQPSSQTITDYLFTLVHTYVVLLNCTDPKMADLVMIFFRGKQKLEH